MQNKLDKIFLTNNFILFKLSLQPKLINLICTFHSEINIFRNGLVAKQSLIDKSARESLEGIMKVFMWRINNEISADEFSVLYNEWLKSSGTSWTCSTFFQLERMNIYNENEIIFILKRMLYNKGNLDEFISTCIQYLNEEYNNYLLTTPIIGFDSNGEKISMLDDNIITLMDEIFSILDIDSIGCLNIDQIFFFFLCILIINQDYNELLKLPYNKQIDYQQFYSEYINKKFQNLINHIKCFSGKVTRSQFKNYILIYNMNNKKTLMTMKETLNKLLNVFYMKYPEYKDEYYLNIFKLTMNKTLSETKLKIPAEINLFHHFSLMNFLKYAHNQNYLIGLRITNELVFAQEINMEFKKYYGEEFLANIKFTIETLNFFLTLVKKYHENVFLLVEYAIYSCNLPYYDDHNDLLLMMNTNNNSIMDQSDSFDKKRKGNHTNKKLNPNNTISFDSNHHHHHHNQQQYQQQQEHGQQQTHHHNSDLSLNKPYHLNLSLNQHIIENEGIYNSKYKNSHVKEQFLQHSIATYTKDSPNMYQNKPISNVEINLMNYHSFNPNNHSSISNMSRNDSKDSRKSIEPSIHPHHHHQGYLPLPIMQQTPLKPSDITHMNSNNNPNISLQSLTGHKDPFSSGTNFTMSNNNHNNNNNDGNDDDIWTFEKNLLLREIVKKKSKNHLLDENVKKVKNLLNNSNATSIERLSLNDVHPISSANLNNSNSMNININRKSTYDHIVVDNKSIFEENTNNRSVWTQNDINNEDNELNLHRKRFTSRGKEDQNIIKSNSVEKQFYLNLKDFGMGSESQNDAIYMRNSKNPTTIDQLKPGNCEPKTPINNLKSSNELKQRINENVKTYQKDGIYNESIKDKTPIKGPKIIPMKNPNIDNGSKIKAKIPKSVDRNKPITEKSSSSALSKNTSNNTLEKSQILKNQSISPSPISKTSNNNNSKRVETFESVMKRLASNHIKNASPRKQIKRPV